MFKVMWSENRTDSSAGRFFFYAKKKRTTPIVRLPGSCAMNRPILSTTHIHNSTNRGDCQLCKESPCSYSVTSRKRSAPFTLPMVGKPLEQGDSSREHGFQKVYPFRHRDWLVLCRSLRACANGICCALRLLSAQAGCFPALVRSSSISTKGDGCVFRPAGKR